MNTLQMQLITITGNTVTVNKKLSMLYTKH
jgi:hypothetical protein